MKGQRKFSVVGGDGKFRTEDTSTYDEDRFYTAAGQDKVMISVAIPQHIHMRMQRLMLEKRIPEYVSPTAIIRDAVIHRMHYLADKAKDEELLTALEDQIRQIELEQLGKRVEDLTLRFEAHHITMQKFLDTRDWYAFCQYLRILKVQLAEDVYSTPWNEKLEDFIDTWEMKVPENWRYWLEP